MNRLHLLVLAAVTGAAVVAPGSAYATARPHSQVRADAAHDVAHFDFATSGTPTSDPTRTQGDILSTSSVHAGRTVRVSARLADLMVASGSGQSAYGFGIRTAKHREFVAVMELAKGSTRGRTHLENGSGHTVRCRTTWQVSAATKTVSVVVPRSCLGRPRWVRTGVGSVDQRGSTIYVDDARTTGVSPATPGSFPTYGPKLFH